MPFNARASLINGAFLTAMLWALASPAGSALAQTTNLQLVYEVTFANGTLDPSIDLLGVGPLKEGDAQVPGSNPTATPQDGELMLQVTRPASAIGPASVGVFATPVSFGQRTAFEERATFIKPVGPHEAGDVWAAGALSARTGDNTDLASDTRVVATLQVAGQHLRLNAVGSKSSTFVNLPDDTYTAIFDPNNPQPFTLDLMIDRVSGAARVSLTIGDRTFSRNVNFPAFQANSGPVITAVGPGIAIATALDETASVHLRDFQILAPSN